jgi:hypothetical protein
MTAVVAGSVTGRDNYIIMNALAYAIEAISRLPERWQERSDQKDMIALLDAMSDQPDFFRIGARGHLQRRGTTMKDGQRVLNELEPCVVVRLDGVRR